MGSKDRVAAGLLAIFVGGLGIHKFYLGYNKEGIITLVISLVTCGAGAAVMSVIGLIEGIIYLTKTEEEFEYTYVEGYKGWF
ncbi:MAG: TM2 domain-containing protein [Lachnospiraceae bacterium]|nr:TM2 domain-containing protein [Lachnospiraceae bacterium]